MSFVERHSPETAIPALTKCENAQSRPSLLKRITAPLHAIAATVTVASVGTGIAPLTQAALISGGPVMMVWGFAFTSLMTLTIALSLANLASGFPGVKGGLIEYSRRLAPTRWRRIAPWVVGWLHFFAFATGAASCAFSLAIFATATISMLTGWVIQRWITVLIHIAVSVLFGVINACNLNIDFFSVILHVTGPIIILLTVIASNKSPPSTNWVFTHFENQTGWTNSLHVILLGLVQGAFTLTGFDAPIHISYNIENAAWKVPQGILFGFVASFTMGETLILTLLYGIKDFDAVVKSVISGLSIAEIFILLVGRVGAACILAIFMGIFFFCGQGITRACGEIGLELAAGGALPKSDYLSKVGHQGQPARVGWLCVCISCSLGLIYLGNTTALQALTSAVAIELNLVYAIPIALHLFFPQPDRFQPGPFSLGRWGAPVNTIAILWSFSGPFIFSVPGNYPVTTENMNYASILLFMTLSFIFGYWFISARHWYLLESSEANSQGMCQSVNIQDKADLRSRGTTSSIDTNELDEMENWLGHLECDLKRLEK